METTHSSRYKDAMARLEVILRQIDSTDVGIDELSGLVEEAAELLKVCRGILQDTSKNVENALASLDQEFKNTDAL